MKCVFIRSINSTNFTPRIHGGTLDSQSLYPTYSRSHANASLPLPHVFTEKSPITSAFTPRIHGV